MANGFKFGSHTTAVTTFTTIPKGMKTTFSDNISESFCCTRDNLPSVCRLSKGHISKILARVSCVK